MTNPYLDFDEAVTFLNTNPSTLYKWLQNGKVPGHKLGRQWRFIREELELHLSGQIPALKSQQDTAQLSSLLNSRAPTGQAFINIAEQLIWDGFHHQATAIHLQPGPQHYQILYRTTEGLKNLLTIQPSLATQIDQLFSDLTFAQQDDYARRAYLRNETDTIQLSYQKIDTLNGPHITLKLDKIISHVPTLAAITPDEQDRARFNTWLERPHGVIAVTGPLGSGKTTTLFSLLNHLKQQDKVVFTLEDESHMLLDAIQQIRLPGLQKEMFDQAFARICGTDADVVAFVLSSMIGLEQAIYQAAYRIAATGRLAFLHIHAPSCTAALQRIEKHVPELLSDNLLIGISSQTLVRHDDKTRKPVYEMAVF